MAGIDREYSYLVVNVKDMEITIIIVKYYSRENNTDYLGSQSY